MKTKLLWVNAAAVIAMFGLSVNASELVYTPINPSFGGNALNSSHLLNTAGYTAYSPDEDDLGYEESSALDNLASSLESRLISQLLADVGDGNSGQLETDEFYLNIVDDGGSLVVQIVDKNTGESTEIKVAGLTPDL